MDENKPTPKDPPKRRRRTKEEIEADNKAKEEAKKQREEEREKKAAEKEEEKARKAEEKRLKNGPWTDVELEEMADAFAMSLPHAKRIQDRWERSLECYVLNGEWSQYGVAEVVGSTGEIYTTSLKKCTCKDFRFRNAECCKHQLCLVDYLRGDRSEEQRLKDEEEHRKWKERIEAEAKQREEAISLELKKIRDEEEAVERKKKRRKTGCAVIIVGSLILWIIILYFMAK